MPEFEFMHSVMISGILNECKRAHCTTRVGHVGIKLGSCLLSCLIRSTQRENFQNDFVFDQNDFFNSHLVLFDC